MKTAKSILIAITAILIAFSALAQTKGITGNTIPLVPVEVMIKGRQAIANYLGFRIDHVYLKFSGRSIASTGWYDRYFDRNQLRDMGYVHDGSFGELSDALASVPMSLEVVPTPEGYYEVMVNVTYYTDDNRESFIGVGWLDIYRDKDGNLTAGQIQPWVSVNGTVGIEFTNDISTAKWVGYYGNEKDLSVWWSYDGTKIVAVPLNLLEEGNLLVANWDGKISGWNLSTGNVLESNQVFALLGQTRSSDIETLRNPSTIDAGGRSFYRSGDKVFGRFPLRNVTFDNGFKGVLDFIVPVWGSRSGISPAKIFITPVRLDNVPTEWVIGREYSLQSLSSGIFILAVPAGEYNIRTEFDGVLDWESDPNPKG